MMINKSFIAAAFFIISTAVYSQSYPNKPVKIIVPYGPGGISDIAARMIGAKLSEIWKQPVIVENKVGGGGNIGTGIVARSDPDGYTLLVATVAEFTIAQHLNKQTSVNPLRDFTPISLLTDTPMLIVANINAPFNNLRQLAEYSKLSSSGISFATPGVGTLNHLTGERLATEMGIKLVHIPYKGGAQASLAVVSGETPLGVAGAGVVMAHVDAGKLKVLAVASQQQIKGHPNWPTVIDAGFPDFIASNWVALAAPRGTPQKIILKIHSDVSAILRMDDVREQLTKMGSDPIGSSPEVLAERINRDSIRYSKVIEITNMRSD
jgi:tripartite-type tricarboxylate transporter receptor subunit TctC